MKTDIKQSARERLLAAANELFYAEGVQTVGIDRVIEHAGVAKASLYNTFGSKENLVQAYLERPPRGDPGKAAGQRCTPQRSQAAAASGVRRSSRDVRRTGFSRVRFHHGQRRSA